MSFIASLNQKKAFSQITLINDELGLNIYPNKKNDTVTINYIKGYPNCTMKLFFQDWDGNANFEMYDKNGILKLKGQFIGGKDTLTRYIFSKVLAVIDNKSHSDVRLLKYLYLLKNGIWFYYDNNKKIVKQEEYEYEFY